ncbi:hypothetical protein P154DRAFT_558769 [Amniculicola lignicola CBS 123094]|uniref:Uncharacterized protein n=1 Tax=Amniculicola lignicola CBS 123094 TaxID=1392246 RepID=A0A6A5X3T8_9PLEO|nr:hypothetical protein P154DRAFT_558769 [Amniculicola lignicola CBS 123094]
MLHDFLHPRVIEVLFFIITDLLAMVIILLLIREGKQRKRQHKLQASLKASLAEVLLENYKYRTAELQHQKDLKAIFLRVDRQLDALEYEISGVTGVKLDRKKHTASRFEREIDILDGRVEELKQMEEAELQARYLY